MFTLYSLLKFIHVVAVIIWVGGLSTMSLMTVQLAGSKQRDTLSKTLSLFTRFGQFVVGPAAIITLIAGISLTLWAELSFEMLWISWGFMGILVSLILDGTLVRCSTTRLNSLLSDHRARSDQAPLYSGA